MTTPYRFLALLVASASLAFAAQPAWVQTSNQNAVPVLEYLGRYAPEYGSDLGLEQYDPEVTDLKPRVYERSLADAEILLAALKAKIPPETNAKVRQDLEILVDNVELQINSSRLNHELMLPYTCVAQNVFEGLQVLLDSRNKPERRQRALVRLQHYAGLAGAEPLVTLAEARSTERFTTKNLTGPYVVAVNKDLGNTERFIAGIAQLFTAAQLDGWQDAHARLAAQLRAHDEWVRREIIPRARPTNQLPAAIYADNLKNYGVRMSPQELIDRGLFGFLEIRDEMQVLAQRIATAHHFPSSDYRAVLRELKKDQITGAAILPYYHDILTQLEHLVAEHHIVTLPQRAAVIRLASEAESASQPAPHLNPPRLLGNTGEYGEIVLPLTNPNAAHPGELQDDFTTKAYAWTLTAHEARPGHELQFSAMVEQGVSTPRAVFAFNSANVEGWALYMEAVMKQYEPPEGQLFALQARLHRAARAFLDPMLNLGLMKPEAAQQFLVSDVGLSAPFATQEIDRYTFRAPGQATSYYYGYLRLRQIRAQTELVLRDRFNEMAFHDFILSQGLLPPELLAKAVREEFIPAAAAPAESAPDADHPAAKQM
ncbi:DUF885 domain-containing protein [Horticoccus luteus]|uniref:DUF885 domain-containing protein n=1 Tax=Horticoccus luteus TaxID=2862869 RepID=A0A8F9TS60_9BACT|nr:DUF885 domain-containing protein [Horticoccus luteus]QYM78224.1 DUF885 domain-containing protein [Horticoccus luteus]